MTKPEVKKSPDVRGVENENFGNEDSALKAAEQKIKAGETATLKLIESTKVKPTEGDADFSPEKELKVLLDSGMEVMFGDDPDARSRYFSMMVAGLGKGGELGKLAEQSLRDMAKMAVDRSIDEAKTGYSSDSVKLGQAARAVLEAHKNFLKNGNADAYLKIIETQAQLVYDADLSYEEKQSGNVVSGLYKDSGYQPKAAGKFEYDSQTMGGNATSAEMGANTPAGSVSDRAKVAKESTLRGPDGKNIQLARARQGVEPINTGADARQAKREGLGANVSIDDLTHVMEQPSAEQLALQDDLRDVLSGPGVDVEALARIANSTNNKPAFERAFLTELTFEEHTIVAENKEDRRLKKLSQSYVDGKKTIENMAAQIARGEVSTVSGKKIDGMAIDAVLGDLSDKKVLTLSQGNPSDPVVARAKEFAQALGLEAKS